LISKTQWISDRAIRIQSEIGQLKKEREELQSQIQGSKYTEEHLKGNLKQIQHLLHQALNEVIQISETQGSDIWKDLQQKVSESLNQYKEHLHTCAGRKEYVESKKCLSQLEKLLFKIKSMSPQKGHALELSDTKLICCVCLDKEVQCSMSCGHLMCNVCTQSVDKCPVCRREILPQDVRPIYFS